MLNIELNKKYAVLFPGQGSQYKGMITGIESSRYFNEILTKASDICSIDFFELMRTDNDNQLNLTKYTQPALLVSSYILWKHFCDYLKRNNLPDPAYLAGHSLGEYTALVAAEVLDISDAIKLVYHRGLYMQESCKENQGGMAAILGLPNEKVAELVNQFKLTNEDKNLALEIANYNALGQVVVSGSKSFVEDFINYVKSNGAKIATMLPVSVAAHSSLMLQAASKLSDLLSKTNFHSPKIPVYSNVSARVHEEDTDLIKSSLLEQMTKSVRWVEIIQSLSEHGVNSTYEIGVNNVLTKLNRRIDKSIKSSAFNDIKELECK